MMEIGKPLNAGLICRHGLTGPVCGAAATWHTLIGPDEQLNALFACDEHLQIIESYTQFLDKHPTDPTKCSVNGGGIWVWSTQEPPGYCTHNDPRFDTALQGEVLAKETL
jgi:hypothetical protein